MGSAIRASSSMQRPGGPMKFGLVVRAVAGVALCASGATAQVCQGDLSFRSPTHLGAALAMSNHTTSFGGGATWGHRQGLYGGGSVGVTHYDAGAGNAVAGCGGGGYQKSQPRRNWEDCPRGHPPLTLLPD